MRLLLVASLVSAAYAAGDNQRWNTEVRTETLERHDSFKPGYMYRFNLEAQVSNGLAVPGSQQAALRSKSLVTLSFPESETVAHLRIDKIRFASLQKEMEQSKELKPFELFDEIDMNEDHLRLLRLPLRFRYENGLVSGLEFDREDAEWSKNVKRVYLNMLQLNLARSNLSSDPHRLYTDSDAAYSLSETTLEGDCEVFYTVLPYTRNEEKKELLVTKSISFDNCTRRVGQKSLGLLLEREPSEKKEESRSEVESSTLFNYRVRGTPERFLIKEVELRSRYVYAPLGEENSLFLTVVSGNLRLLEITKEDEPIPAPKSNQKESLLHSTEWEKKEAAFLATGDETLLRDSPYPEMKNKPEIVIRMVKSLVAHMESEEKGIELAATHEMGRIVRVLRLASKEDIWRMHVELCSSSKDAQLKEAFTDALAIAGSFNCVQHLVEKIRARELSTVRATKILKQLSSVPVPSEQIVRSLLSLCKDSKSEPLERQTCWLSVGALMNGVCGADVAVESESCPRDVKERFVADLVEQYEEAESRYEKVLALKSLGNSGMDLIVFPLEKIVRDAREERIVRVNAIEALRKLRTVMPRKITAILLPLYKNGAEHPEIRVAAFKQIIKSLPDQAVLHQLVHQLNREGSTQVHAYVSDALLSLSRSVIPAHARMASTLQHALKSLRPRSSSRKTTSSTVKFFSTVNEENGNEATLSWATLFANDSSLPKEIFTSGRWNKYVGHLGLTQHNMDQQLYKLLEFLESSPSLDAILRSKRSTSGSTGSEMLRGLFSKLAITRREKFEKDAHVFAYFRSNDMDHVLLPLDEKMIAHLLKNLDGHVDKIASLLAKGLRFSTLLSTVLNEQKHTLVHSMGMPLVYSTKLPVIFKIEGELKADLKKGSVQLRANPTIAATHVTKVEILSPLVNLGVKILHSATLNLPVDIKREVTWKDQLVFQTTVRLPEESQRLLQLSSRPVTFVRVWPKETRVYVQAKESTIYVDQLETLVHRVQDSYLEKATGIEIAVDGHYHGHIFDKEQDIPQALLIGENNLEVRFEKTPQTPKEYVFKAEIGLFNENTRMERPSMERFLQKGDHLETEDYDDFEESEKSRRGEFEKYVEEYETEQGYEHRMHAEIRSVGGRKEHKAKVELRTECDARMRHCRIKVNGLRTPMLEDETRDHSFNVEIEMLYPAMPKSLKQLAAQKHRELSVSVEAEWGCEEKNEIRMKIQGEQNKEQKKWMKMVSELRDEKLTPMEEYYRLLQASMLNQYKAVVEYDIRTPASYRLINAIYSKIKADAPFFSTTLENGRGGKNTLRAKVTLEPATRKYATISIHTPTEKVTIYELAMPFALPLANIRRQPSAPVRSLSHIGSALVNDVKAVCTVNSDRIRTFDDVIFRTPLTTCYSVLAKDCSSEEKPRFAVLVKKISESGEGKKMQIVSKRTVIELEMDKLDKNVIVTIDGEESESAERLERAGIYKMEQLVVVDLGDVSVEFDGFTANVKMSQYFKGKQCGICGHFDGEKKGEFRRADNEETEDLEEFHRSYLVKDKECKVEEEKLSEKHNYGIEEESDEGELPFFETKQQKKAKKTGSDYEETVEPEHATRVVEYSNRVCFSKKAVPDCPEQTVADQEKLREMKVSFACFPRSDAQTARFLREARREVLDLEDFPVSFSEIKHVPKVCIAY